MGDVPRPESHWERPDQLKTYGCRGGFIIGGKGVCNTDSDAGEKYGSDEYAGEQRTRFYSREKLSCILPIRARLSLNESALRFR